MKVCKYCGTENQDSQNYCISCGAQDFKYRCNNCGTLFDEGNFCPKCGVREGTEPKKCPNCGTEYYSAACPNCGFTSFSYRSNHNTAQTQAPIYINTSPQPVKKRKTWLWVLGWIIIFPIPLTILLLRKKDMKPSLKYGIIATAWIVFFAMAFFGGKTSGEETKTQDSTNQNTQATEEVDKIYDSDNQSNQTENKNKDSVKESNENAIKNFVKKYNESAPTKLEFFESFEVQSNSNSHYKTEFRLPAYEDAVGLSYTVNGQSIDFVAKSDYFGKTHVRIYCDSATLDQCIEIIRYASPVFDPALDESEIEKAVEYVSENKEANGYYYGDVGLVMTKHNGSFDFMMKEGND